MSRLFSFDPRWQGPQKHYFSVSTLRSLILIIYVIVVVVEGALLRSWLSDEGHGTYHADDAPYNFWARAGTYLVLDAALSITMAFFVYKGQWHPIAALVTAILAVGLWLSACVINSLCVYSNEYSFRESDAWQRIGYGELALQVLITAGYLTMMGFAAKAVHDWRKSGKEGLRRADESVEAMRGAYGKRSLDEREFVQGKNGSAV